jgi:esterase/lipase superfamily enzyme
VLASALEKLGTKQELTRQKDGASVPVFKHIVFAAADISPAIFEKLIEPVIKSRHTVTSYISSNDKILWLSQTRNLEPRIGFGFKHLPKCVDSIDVSAAGRRFAHSTWADSPPVIDDLRNLTRYSIAPALRGLHARTRPGQTYWALETKVPAKLASIGAKTHHTLLPCANLAP